MSLNIIKAFSFIVNAKRYNISNIIKIITLQPNIILKYRYMFMDIFEIFVKIVPREESSKIYDFMYANLQMKNIQYHFLSVEQIKIAIKQFDMFDETDPSIREYILTINDGQILSAYVQFLIKPIKNINLCCLLLEACKYDDVIMIDLLLDNNKIYTLIKNYRNNSMLNYEKDYMKYIITCRRVNKVASVIPAVIKNADKVPINLIMAILKNNIQIAELYFQSRYTDYRATYTIKYILQNELVISDEMLEMLIKYSGLNIFNIKQHHKIALLGKQIDFGEYYSLQKEYPFTHWDMNVLGTLPKSTLFDKIIEFEPERIFDNGDDGDFDGNHDISLRNIISHYVAHNNVLMLFKLREKINFNFSDIYSRMILCAYMSESYDTFSYIFWTDSNNLSYMYFLASMNRWNKDNIIIPNEIKKNILAPIVHNFWTDIVNE